MKKLFSMSLLAALVSLPVLGAVDNAPMLITLKVTSVENTGKVLKHVTEDEMERYSVGVPVEVQLPNGCTKFVGIEKYALKIAGTSLFPSIVAKGAIDPVNEVCTAVAPSPIKAVVVVDFSLKSDEDRRNQPLTKRMRIGADTYEIRLNSTRDLIDISKP